MEVSVDRDAFLKGLQMVHNVVEPRQTLPILANVLLESDGDTLRLTATAPIRSRPMTHQVRGVVAKGKGQPVTVETIEVPDPGPGEALPAEGGQ